MSYVAPCFCADRVMPYPREGVILAQATDRSNPQYNLFHLDLVFSNAIYGMTILKKNVMLGFRWLQAHVRCGVRIYSWYPRTHTYFFIFTFTFQYPPDLNKSLNCSLCNPSSYAYLYREGYVVLVYHQNTPKGPRTTSCNSWTWIKSHNGDKDLPKALCCWRATIEDWDCRQQRKTLF